MGAAQTKPLGPGPPGREPLPPLIHGRIRLLILSVLVRAGRPRTFTEVRESLGVTDGTLSVNLAKLEEGGLVTVAKTFVGRRPRTQVRLTAAGRREFGRYVDDLRAIVPGLEVHGA